MKIVEIIDDTSTIKLIDSDTTVYSLKKTNIQYLKTKDEALYIFANEIAFHLTYPSITNPVTSSVEELRIAIELMIDFPNKNSDVSIENSTTIPLGPNNNFTGDWQNVLKYTNIGITITTDQPSAPDGLKIEYSSDGINIDADDLFNVFAGTNKQFTFGITAKYFRVNYTNGATPQTYFRLQTILHTKAPKPSSHRVNDSIIDEDDAELVKAIITGQAANGEYKNVKVSDTGNLSTTVEGIERLDSGFSFISTLSRVSLTAPEDVVLLRNPLGSGKNVKFSGFELYFNNASFVTWEVYRNPTVTLVGVALATINANGTSLEVAVATLYDLPTIAVVGTRIRVFASDINNKSNKEPYQIVIAPGQDILLRRVNVGVNNDLRLTFQWTEEDE